MSKERIIELALLFIAMITPLLFIIKIKCKQNMNESDMFTIIFAGIISIVSLSVFVIVLFKTLHVL